MKNLLLSLFISLIALTTYSQNNLEFSQVLILKGDIGGNATVIAGTVPAGKVWKVENIAIGTSVLWEQLTGSTAVQLSASNGNYVSISDASAQMTQPVWLPAGEDIRLRSFTSATRGYYFSVIEFNVGN